MRCYTRVRADHTGTHDKNTYELRHILQTPHSLSLRVAVVIADIHSSDAIGHIVATGRPNKNRQKLLYLAWEID